MREQKLSPIPSNQAKKFINDLDKANKKKIKKLLTIYQKATYDHIEALKSITG